MTTITRRHPFRHPHCRSYMTNMDDVDLPPLVTVDEVPRRCWTRWHPWKRRPLGYDPRNARHVWIAGRLASAGPQDRMREHLVIEALLRDLARADAEEPHAQDDAGE